jgi:hypothetical protein
MPNDKILQRLKNKARKLSKLLDIDSHSLRTEVIANMQARFNNPLF